MLQLFVAVGAGFLLSVAFLRMLPEALALEPVRALPLVVTGYFLTHVFEHAAVPHFHFGEETHHDVVHGRSSFAAVFGLGLHSLFDGVSIAAGYAVSPVLGWLVFVAIALHKLPEGFTIASIVLASGQSRRRAMGAATLVGAMCVLGALMLAERPDYVAATDLLPEVNKEVGHNLALTVLAGVLLYLLASWTLQQWVPG